MSGPSERAVEASFKELNAHLRKGRTVAPEDVARFLRGRKEKQLVARPRVCRRERDPMNDTAMTLDRTWTDADGEPLGGWVEIDREEYMRLIEEAGGYWSLTVFSSLTDPEGQYGEPTIYTAWGHKGDYHPLVDIRDTGMDGHGGLPERQTFRKFVEVSA